ncbi:MAG: hypothetical protein P1V36_00285 [Planctomycetota bacterium]|nr:hypothetical protein [Planctomycetota bacterium]
MATLDVSNAFPVDDIIDVGLANLVGEAHSTAFDKGWWDAQTLPSQSETDYDLVLKTVPEKLALIHSEVSEALEAYREGENHTYLDARGKPEGLPAELADVVIRVADLCGALGIDLGEAVMRKMAYNKTRSHRHGGKIC